MNKVRLEFPSLSSDKLHSTLRLANHNMRIIVWGSKLANHVPIMFLFLQSCSNHVLASIMFLLQSCSCSDEGLTLETSAFQSLYGGQFTLSTPLINQIFVFHSPTDATPQFLQKLTPFTHVPISQLVNAKQPSNPPLTWAFCSTYPPPPCVQLPNLPSLQRHPHG